MISSNEKRVKHNQPKFDCFLKIYTTRPIYTTNQTVVDALKPRIIKLYGQ